MPTTMSTLRVSRSHIIRTAKQQEFEQKQAAYREGRGPKPIWYEMTGAPFLPPGFEYIVPQVAAPTPTPPPTPVQCTTPLIPESPVFQPAIANRSALRNFAVTFLKEDQGISNPSQQLVDSTAAAIAAAMPAGVAEALAIRFENLYGSSVTTDRRSSSPESVTLVGSGTTTPDDWNRQHYYSASAYPTFIAPQHRTFSTASTAGSATEEDDLESQAVVQSVGYNADGSFTSYGSHGSVRW